ncbi:MAG: thioredoxin protein [Anaerosolibacter sp.]|uniref:thioredoxin domain-containing protein n=1 Tax=Anaerosolibacter sp. TaxID=1872527 RepID=UPI002606A299|nr:thioredoxin domain-containing protein [Anaerosolibacter sp.]MDF2547831.1 thioredoxin protein [Anaerosolibacter sp.]
MTEYKYTNKLIQEKSPYLLQHAHNPVDWYPWGAEAFDRAVSEDKPIFLSIGYSTCHWCHVMERESFEDKDVAEVLNKHFISIKVDREERPDIDHIYMSFCQAMTGQGGWPLTVILTPEKKPFFAGTYFPKTSKYGQPGIIDLLNQIQDAWTNRRDELVESSQKIIEAVKTSVLDSNRDELDKEIIHTTYNELKHFFDPVYGGFGKAPKFPAPHNLSFLLRYYAATGQEEALGIVEKTLDGMYAGGIFDHIGFGFARYSTDQQWLVPHFEKMLYDNALLIIAYVEAFQVTGNYRYAEVAEKVLTYILRDMSPVEGGFYSAEDADSEGEEGKFYVFDMEEVNEVLGKNDGELYSQYYNIKKGGNFEGKSIPNLIGVDLGKIENDPELKEKLSLCREKLYHYREQRIHPFKDDKTLTSWNGLMIAATAYAGRVLDNIAYIHAAKKTAGFIMQRLVREDGRLLARYREGEAAYPAYIDDYAFLIWGLIELYETTYETIYLEKAIGLTNDMISLFWDEKEGGFFIYGGDSESLIVRPKEIYDGATPSGNSVATYCMLRLARMTGNKEFEEKAMSQFQTFGGNVKENPNSYTHFMMAYLFANMHTKGIVIAGKREQEDTKRMLAQLEQRFLPFAVVIYNDENLKLQDLVPFAKNQRMVGNKATAYVCENFACSIPTSDIDQFIQLLSANNQLK